MQEFVVRLWLETHYRDCLSLKPVYNLLLFNFFQKKNLLVRLIILSGHRSQEVINCSQQAHITLSLILPRDTVATFIVPWAVQSNMLVHKHTAGLKAGDLSQFICLSSTTKCCQASAARSQQSQLIRGEEQGTAPFTNTEMLQNSTVCPEHVSNNIWSTCAGWRPHKLINTCNSQGADGLWYAHSLPKYF